MSNDEATTKDLIQVLEDGKNGYAKGAAKLRESDRPDLATVFQRFSEQRGTFVAELRQLSVAYGDDVKEQGSVAGAVHRGWMTVKDAMSGDDPDGVLDVAEQGEDHAVSEFDKALARDLSTTLRTVVERQGAAVRAAHDEVRRLRAAAHR
jgi:uncharacterized protein (TIGR02284 family)